MKSLKTIKTLKIVYLIIFLTLAFWSIFAYITLRELVSNQKSYATLINISGKQRMLSQKTTLFVKRFYESKDEKVLKHLLSLVNMMKDDHTFVINNLTSTYMQSIYFNKPYDLDAKVKKYFTLLDSYLDKPNKEKINLIQNYSFDLLPQLNYAVYEFENELNLKIIQLEKREFYILIFALITLLLEAIFIIIPSIKSNEKNVKKLKQMNKILEKKVHKEISKAQVKDELISRNSKIITMSKLIDNIAHYWRQPLSIISVSASGMLVKKEFDKLDDDELVKSLNEIVKNSTYLSNTIEKYRSMFDSKDEKKDLIFNDVYEKSLSLLSTNLRENNIKTYANIDKVKLFGFESDLIQVMVFIYENAKDILISKDVQDRVIFTNIKKVDKKIILSIQDSGGGIDKDIIKYLFSDDFNTQKREVSSGMALYISHQIIKNSFAGEIVVTNEEFEVKKKKYFGACFKFILPIIK